MNSAASRNEVRAEFFQIVDTLTKEEQLKAFPWLMGYLSAFLEESDLPVINEAINRIKEV